MDGHSEDVKAGSAANGMRQTLSRKDHDAARGKSEVAAPSTVSREHTRDGNQALSFSFPPLVTRGGSSICSEGVVTLPLTYLLSLAMKHRRSHLMSPCRGHFIASVSWCSPDFGAGQSQGGGQSELMMQRRQLV